MTEWEKRINEKKAVIGVLGLGYVGLPLVREFTSAGLSVVGFDIDAQKVKILNSGKSIIKHIPHSDVAKMKKSGLFDATCDMKRIREDDAVIICVPTPLTINRKPDMQYIVKSTETISKYLRQGQLIS